MNKTKKNAIRKGIASVLTGVLFLNTNVLTGAFIISSLYPEAVYAGDPDDQVFEKLKEKYNTDDPYRHNRSEQKYEVIPRASKDLTDSLEQSLNSANSRDNELDFSEYTETPRTLADGLDDAKSVAVTASSPQMGADKSVNMELSEEGTAEVYRDEETGELKVRQKAGAGGSKKSVSIGQSEIFSSEINHSNTAWEGEDTYGDEDALYEAGRKSHTRLRDNSTNTGESAAYKTIMNSADRGANQTAPEHIIQPGLDYIDEATQPGGDAFAACSTITTTEESSLYRPEINEYYCQDMNGDNPFYCEVHREYRVPVFMEGGGVRSCGVGCYEFDLGQAGFDYWQVGCEEFSDEKMVTLDLSDGVSIESVRVDGYTDDHSEISVNGNVVYTSILGNQSTSGSLPPVGWGQCNGGDNRTINYNITSSVKNAIPAGSSGEFNFKLRTLVGDLGEHFVTFQIRLADDSGEGFGEIISDYPEGCSQGLNFDTSTVSSGGGGGGGGTEPPGAIEIRSLSTSSTSSTSTSGTNDDNGVVIQDDHLVQEDGVIYGLGPTGSCYFTGYEQIDVSTNGYSNSILNQLKPMYPGDDGEKTWAVNLQGYTCDPFEGGEFCVDVEGEEEPICQTWEEIMANGGTCAAYEDDPNCVEIDRECADESWTFGEWDDHCFNETVTYECDDGADVTYSYETTTSTCDSMLECAGGDCDFDEQPKNERFLEAVAMGNVAEHVQGDQTCEDPSDPSTCTIFEGDRQYCSWALASDWGNNCCEAPEGVNFLTYLSAMRMMMKFENQQLGGVYTQPVKDAVSGAWKTISDPVTDFASSAWDSVSSVFTSGAEATVGNASATAVNEGAATALGEGGMGVVAQTVSQFIYDALPAELGNMLFTTTATEAGTQVTGYAPGLESAMDFIGGVMFWYSVYQMAQLIGSLLTACDDTDNDTALKKEMRQCYPVDDKYCTKEVLGICYMRRQDYCCYPSMLSRIIMEQAHVILDKDMSSCSGLNHEELQALDFNEIDLSEWIATLVTNDMLPENTEEAQTGSGRRENNEGRQTVSERTKERTEGMAGKSDDIKEGLTENLDCSIYPRPPICEYGINIANPDESGG
ncbi:MAG: hypothetical protein CMF12_13905 [Idiomarina sp.]|uniref:conjugal transfer protein TraN n=1 Tax=Idiomarina sp. TaxID=1874361 RepID=UPI000C37947A|nr:conjugal transfer protein TraN [Idiomarina sp.]MBT43600.1 hypothetical protein [Idiomarina sp.]